MICIYYLFVKSLFENSVKIEIFCKHGIEIIWKICRYVCNYVTEIILKNVDALCSVIMYDFVHWLNNKILLKKKKSYSFNFKGGLCNRRAGYCPYRAPCPEGEQFLWFLKNALLWFHLILFFFLLTQSYILLDVLGEEYYS